MTHIAIAFGLCLSQKPGFFKRPSAPLLHLPTPYNVFDFATYVNSNKGLELRIAPKLIHGSILIEVSIVNNSSESILVPPLSEDLCYFEYYQRIKGRKGPLVCLYDRHFLRLRGNRLESALIKLPMACALSVFVAVPNVKLPGGKAQTYIRGTVTDYIGKSSRFFSLSSTDVILERSR